MWETSDEICFRAWSMPPKLVLGCRHSANQMTWKPRSLQLNGKRQKILKEKVIFISSFELETCDYTYFVALHAYSQIGRAGHLWKLVWCICGPQHQPKSAKGQVPAPCSSTWVRARLTSTLPLGSRTSSGAGWDCSCLYSVTPRFTSCPKCPHGALARGHFLLCGSWLLGI